MRALSGDQLEHAARTFLDCQHEAAVRRVWAPGAKGLRPGGCHADGWTIGCDACGIACDREDNEVVLRALVLAAFDDDEAEAEAAANAAAALADAARTPGECIAAGEAWWCDRCQLGVFGPTREHDCRPKPVAPTLTTHEAQASDPEPPSPTPSCVVCGLATSLTYVHDGRGAPRGADDTCTVSTALCNVCQGGIARAGAELCALRTAYDATGWVRLARAKLDALRKASSAPAPRKPTTTDPTDHGALSFYDCDWYVGAEGVDECNRCDITGPGVKIDANGEYSRFLCWPCVDKLPGARRDGFVVFRAPPAKPEKKT